MRSFVTSPRFLALLTLLGVALVAPLAGQTGQTGRTGAPPPAQAPAGEAALVARARAIHDRVITLDTPDDISAANFES